MMCASMHENNLHNASVGGCHTFYAYFRKSAVHILLWIVFRLCSGKLGTDPNLCAPGGSTCR